VVAGIVVVVVVLAVAGFTLLGGSSGETVTPAGRQSQPPAPTASATSEPSQAAPAPAPADTTVTVLNGTTVYGLAAKVTEKVKGAGYATGTPQTYTDQARSASVVFYTRDARRSAFAVAKLLNITDVHPISDPVAQLAQGADVAVVVGADQAP
jgi:hypothetical protein